MKNIILSAFSLLTIGLIVNCSGDGASDYMVLDEVRYVETFPQVFTLDDGAEVDLEGMGIIGVHDFFIYDSLLIFSSSDKEGSWSFVSLPDYHFLGKYLTLGQGPYEFYQVPSAGSGSVKFFKENEELFASIYNFHKGELYKMNIDESIKNNQLDISMLNDSLPVELFDFVAIDSITYFSKELSNDETQQIRYMLVNGEKITPPHFEKLNLAKIKEREDFNILSTITEYDFNTNRIVEIPGHLNYINMYSILISPMGIFIHLIIKQMRFENMIFEKFWKRYK